MAMPIFDADLFDFLLLNENNPKSMMIAMRAGTSNDCELVGGPGTPLRSPQPLSVVCLQMLHHSVVVLIAAGSKADKKVDKGTSPFPLQPGKVRL